MHVATISALAPARAMVAATVARIPAVAILFFVPGAWLLYSGFDSWRVSRLVQDTAPETVRSVAVGVIARLLGLA